MNRPFSRRTVINTQVFFHIIEIIGCIDIGKTQPLLGLSDADIHWIGARPVIIDDAVVNDILRFARKQQVDQFPEVLGNIGNGPFALDLVIVDINVVGKGIIVLPGPGFPGWTGLRPCSG